ncbi:hypothetical protein GA0070612_1467 [Micromonospora chokoriensis]|uniref:Uncharacterized protein n=2 Tax=Micromonospora chokoriensis TaxID=356851 RepID=A0A1C4VI95_9ACTN|nr:hypothetical protein GA0070612_1467 [Micromonospora chokoriensis]
MKLRQFAFIATLMTAASIAGSGVPPTGSIPDGRPAGSVEIIDLNGLRNIEFGDTEDELTRRGILRTSLDSCGPMLVGHDTVSPVFMEDRLVLLWVGDPMRTPEGITAGSPVDQVWARYPEVTRLAAPQGTHRLDGLLARSGDRAYLFLHDGRTVRKTIAGYADWARRLFDEGTGPC